jgi:TetR/AcrR family transcriptional repressor of nem operon
MRVTKEKAAENRAALLREASRLFRERGIDGVGVAEICKAAGLTHGALYAQFPSKDALAAEALAEGLKGSSARLAKLAARGQPTLGDLLEHYISRRHREDLAFGCPLAASASEIARQDRSVSATFVEGFERLVDRIEATLENVPAAQRRDRALTIAAAELGVLAVARAAAKADMGLSNVLLAAGRRVLEELGQCHAAAKPPRRAPRQHQSRHRS